MMTDTSEELIVFVGPDGSGKTSISKRVSHALGDAGWWCALSNNPADWREVNGSALDLLARIRSINIRQPTPIRRAGWALIFALEYVERSVRVHRVLHAAHRDHRLVLADRYPWDLAVGAMWEGKVPRSVGNLLMRPFPKPRLVFLCVGDPERIHARKSDLSPEQIRRTIAEYRELLSKHGVETIELDTTTTSLEGCVAQAVAVVQGAGARPAVS